MQLQLGHGLSTVDDPTWPAGSCGFGPRFNWATASRPWMTWRSLKSAGLLPVLQLGHGLSTVDDRALAAEREVEALLQLGHGLSTVDDMIPSWPHEVQLRLQLGHGLSTVDDALDTRMLNIPQLRFNWATASRPWMTIVEEVKKTRPRPLQLGHGLSTVDDGSAAPSS